MHVYFNDVITTIDKIEEIGLEKHGLVFSVYLKQLFGLL